MIARDPNEDLRSLSGDIQQPAQGIMTSQEALESVYSQGTVQRRTIEDVICRILDSPLKSSTGRADFMFQSGYNETNIQNRYVNRKLDLSTSFTNSQGSNNNENANTEDSTKK
uniref:Cell division protein FtsH n=1 Tax=Rhabditophanes sp. KR3021 TaxID=114890 RepID=A0AC35UFC1_9BILA